MLRPRHIHDTVEQARAEQATDEWKQRYATRAGVEGTIHQAVAVTGVRRCRYTGLPKTRLAHILAATALNLIRLDAWWTGTVLAERRGTTESWWGSAAIDTALALTQLAIRHQIPLGLIAFLEDARSRHLLRTVGPVYQFRHATLQARLAQQPTPTELSRN
jgi:hypothetical protein